MRRFKFHLATVLRHRAAVERTKLQAFAEVQQELVACDARLDVLRGGIADLYATWPRRLDIDEIGRRESYLGVLKSGVEKEERAREGIAARMDDARTALLEARRARQALENLRARAFDAYIRDTQRTEQNLLDEIATMRHERQTA